MLPRRKLENILARVREIERLLHEPDVVRDSTRAHALSKELSSLSETARTYQEFLRVEKELKED